MTEKRIKLTGILVPVMMFIACFIFFFLFYDHHLFFSEQLQIFRITPDFFFSYFSKPASLSSYIGDFITQFYYLPGGGAVTITIISTILWLLIRQLLINTELRNSVNLLSLIPVLFGWIALCNIHYPASVLISFIISVIFTLIYCSIPDKIVRYISGIISIPLLYLFTGSYFYLFTFSAVIFELFYTDDSRKMIFISLYLIIAFLVPVALRRCFLLTYAETFTYLSEMTIKFRLIDYLPIISLIVIFLSNATLSTGKKNQVKSYLSYMIYLVIIFVIVTGFMANTDFTMEKILRLDYEASLNRWNKVYDLSQKYQMRNRLSAYYTNMAMSKLDILPEKLMEHYQPAATGLFIPVNVNENYLTITFSNEVYWHLGDVNTSQHSALLGMIFSPRACNARLMKRLIEINIVNREYAVAEKYINILEKTLFHRKWAEQRRRFLYNEEECEKSEWIAGKRTIIPVRDMLKKGDDYKRSLEMLVIHHPDNSMAIDYLLCYDLLDKNIPSFVKNFQTYYKSEHKVLPRVYEEALLIAIASGRNKPEDFRQFVFSSESVRRIADYTSIYDEHHGDGTFLQHDYGSTYWFYFHFARMTQD
jgi:hypothetical protein